jgi:hypothetical protein
MIEPIICGMDKPDHVVGGVMVCGDCGKPVKLSAGGVSACKNPECVRNKPPERQTQAMNWPRIGSQILSTVIAVGPLGLAAKFYLDWQCPTASP